MKVNIYVALILILLFQPLKAAERSTRLEEVIVTATATEVPVQKLPVNTQVITRREIEISGASNLGDLLSEKLPGHIHKYPGLLTSVGIRGFRTDTHGTDIKGRVLILIDGHRAGTGNLAEIPLENVERIEIIRGPASVLYGSAAMGGVINVITKKGTGKPVVSAGTEYGSWDYNRQYIKASGSLGKLGFSLSVSKTQRNDYEDGEGKEIDNTDYHDWKGSFRIDLSPAKGHSLNLVGQLTEFWKVGSPGPSYNPDPDNYKDVRRKYISFGYTARWNNLLSSNISYYYVQDTSEWHDPSMAWGYSTTKTTTNTQGTRARIYLTPTNTLRITSGFDWDGIRVENFKYPSGIPYSPNSAYDNYAGYLQAEFTYKRLYLVAGVRYDYWKEELRPTGKMQLKAEDEDYDHTTWRIGVSYLLTDWLKARGSVGTGYRTPTADELSGYFNNGWIKIVGNPDLDPEKSITYEAGLDIGRGSLKAGIDYFYTYYKDRIAGGFSICLDGDCTWTTYKNVDGAHLAGIEFYASYDLGEILDLPYIIRPYINGITYLKRNLKDHNYSERLKSSTVPYVSRWNITGGIEAGIPEQLTAELSFFYVGEQEVQEWNWKSPDYGKAVKKGGFTVFNFRIRWNPCKHASLFVAIDNLFDKNYSFVSYYPMPGRSLKIGVEMRF